MEFLSDIASLINSTLRISTPLVFAAMAGIFAERSGVIDFSLEGKMLMAAFVAAVGSYFFGNPWIGYSLAAGGLLTGGMLINKGVKSISNKIFNRTSKKVGKEVAEEVAEGAAKKTLKEAAEQTTKKATKEIGEKASKEVAQNIVRQAMYSKNHCS